MIRGIVSVRVSNRETARSIIGSMQPDNGNLKGLQVTARALHNRASFYISHAGRIETFISTMEDMLRCIQAAEGTLQEIAKK